MANNPAVLWYSSDYLVGVIGMTWEEQGRYVYLLNLQHAKGHLDIDKIMPDCPESVLDKFVQDEDGLYYNERMEEETIKRQKFCESRSSNRNKGNNDDLCVYLIGDPVKGNVKIGSSVDPERRLVELKRATGNDDLYLIAYSEHVTQKLEKQLHDQYKRNLVSGEWYSLSHEDVLSIIDSHHMKTHMNEHMNEHMENENENININNINNNINNNNINITKECEEIIDLYNSICISLPKCVKTTKKRLAHIRRRLKEFDKPTLEFAFRKVEESDFLTGRSGDWRAGFDWIIGSEGNLTKILEGNYDNNGKKPKTTHDKLKQAHEELEAEYERISGHV